MKLNIRSSDSLRNPKNYSFSTADHLRSFLRAPNQECSAVLFVLFALIWALDLHGVCQGIVEIFNIFIASSWNIRNNCCFRKKYDLTLPAIAMNSFLGLIYGSLFVVLNVFSFEKWKTLKGKKTSTNYETEAKIPSDKPRFLNINNNSGKRLTICVIFGSTLQVSCKFMWIYDGKKRKEKNLIKKRVKKFSFLPWR